MSRARVQTSRRAYTLLELLVVIALFVLLISVTIPAFSSMLRSTERSLADTQLRIAIATTRDRAMSSGSGGDAALAAFYEPGGRMRLVTCLEVGRLRDTDPNDPNATVLRDVFVPDPLVEPLSLPRGWMLRGFAPPGSTHVASGNGWYNDGGDDTVSDDPDAGNWVFPETRFFDRGVNNDGSNRQTFIIRFDRLSGAVKPAGPVPALVVDPNDDESSRTSLADDRNIGKATNQLTFVRRLLHRPDLDETARRRILGDESSDTVLAREVTQFALYEEQKLAGALGVRLDRATDSIYQQPAADPEPRLVTGLEPDDINAWIEDRPRTANGGSSDTPSEARVFMMPRYQSRPLEIARGDEEAQAPNP